MNYLYLTPSSISFLAQFMLAVGMTVALGVSVYRREHSREVSFYLLGTMLFYCIFLALMFLDTSLLLPERLVTIALVNPVLAIVLVFVIQSAYRIPRAYPQRKLEAHLSLVLSLAYLVYEVSMAVGRLRLLELGKVEYRDQISDLPLVLVLVWIPITFLVQAVLSDPRATSIWKKVWRPQGNDAWTARNFAIIFLISPILGLFQYYVRYDQFSTLALNLLVSMGSLLQLWLIFFAYIKAMPVITSFLLKLTGTSLTLILAMVGAVGWVSSPVYIASYHPKLSARQSIRFTPNTQGGYDIQLIPYQFESDLGEKLPELESRSGEQLVQQFEFPFYGKTVHQVFPTRSGFITMNRSVYHPNLQNHFGQVPAIFPLLIDMNGHERGGIYARHSDRRLIVTWDQMGADAKPSDFYTFQVILYADGRFDFNYKEFPDPLLIVADTEPYENIWIRGITPGLPASVEITPDLAQTSKAGPEGVLQNFNVSFRKHLDEFTHPLAWLLVISAFILFLGVPLLIQTDIVQPLTALLERIRQVDTGNLDIELPVQNLDEIGVLTQSFNKMIGLLKSDVRDLEQRVAERTTQLELSNRQLEEEMSIRQASQEQLVEHQRSMAIMDERERFSRDLHDGLVQVISSVGMQIDTAQTMFQQGQAVTANAILDSLKTIVREVNADLRSVILGLRQPRQLDADMFNALHEYLTDFSKHSGIMVHLNLPAQAMPPLAPTAEEQILRIIQEALTNVRKHANADRVEILFSADERNMHVMISDDGRGFDIAAPGQLYEKHFGLKMMRERAEILGGTLELRSTEGMGTRVMISIPCSPPNVARQTTKELNELRFVLVDDSPIFLEGLRNLLVSRGLKVVGIARDGLEAQEKVRQLLPDVVIMDVMMPRVNGIQAARTIKNEYPQIKILMLTSSEKEEHLFDAIKNGASGYLIKGSDPDELFQVLLKLQQGETILSAEIATLIINQFQPLDVEAKMNWGVNDSLTEVQSKIIRLMMEGLPYKQIGARLHLSERAIKYQMKQILDRLHLQSRSELIRYANSSEFENSHSIVSEKNDKEDK